MDVREYVCVFVYMCLYVYLCVYVLLVCVCVPHDCAGDGGGEFVCVYMHMHACVCVYVCLHVRVCVNWM